MYIKDAGTLINNYRRYVYEPGTIKISKLHFTCKSWVFYVFVNPSGCGLIYSFSHCDGATLIMSPGEDQGWETVVKRLSLGYRILKHLPLLQEDFPLKSIHYTWKYGFTFIWNSSTLATVFNVAAGHQFKSARNLIALLFPLLTLSEVYSLVLKAFILLSKHFRYLSAGS